MQGKSDLFVAMNILGEMFTRIKQEKNRFKTEQTIYAFAQEKNLLSKSLKEVYYNLEQL
jgi:hypothetical protein